MPSIGVLEHYQNPTDKPMRRIKRSGGQSLVRSGLAIWIRENVLLIMRARTIDKPYANSMSTIRNSTPNSGRAQLYIPAKLPSHKVPGTKTTGPVAEQNGYCRARIAAARIIAMQANCST